MIRQPETTSAVRPSPSPEGFAQDHAVAVPGVLDVIDAVIFEEDGKVIMEKTARNTATSATSSIPT